MCGIGGILMFPMERNEMQVEFIRGLIADLAVENMKRGRDATGIATFKKDGSHNVFKHNVKAEKFVQLETWHDFLKENVTNETTNILIHTRASTQGSPKNNDNNHPIVSATSIGVHNGIIYNDDQLFKKENLFRQAEVDSEVIFRLLDKEVFNKKTASKNVAEKLSGVFAVAYVKKDEPSKLNFFRNTNPTTFAYIKELNIIVFASLKTYIEDALKYLIYEAEYLYKDSNIVNVETVSYYSPSENICLQFDVSKNNPLEQLAQDQLAFEGQGWNAYDYYGGYNTRSSRHKKNETEDETTLEIQDIYQFIEENDFRNLLGFNDYAKLIELLDLREKNEWQRGYRAGRETLSTEIKVRRELDLLKEAEKGKVKEVI